jgi:hypothetical protein
MTMRHVRILAAILAGAILAPGQMGAQTPDSARTDSVSRARARADSAAKADSIALMQELEQAAKASPPGGTGTPRGQVPATGSTNPRLLPDLSVVGDLMYDLSPRGSTQADGSRLGVREVEVALQAVVDPYFRGDVFLGFSDLEKVSIEQAFLTATALPWHLEARLGRQLLPFGKQNTTHRHDLHTFEYPWVIQRFLGAEGGKGTGASLSKIFSPFGFYQEVIVTVNDRIAEPVEGLVPDTPTNKTLAGLGYTARLRNYLDLTQNANLEIAASAATSQVAQPVTTSAEFNAVNARQTLVGVDVTYRWRPLQQGLYRSFILQGEYLRQINEQNPDLPPGSVTYLGPSQGYNGGYLFARYQVGRRSFIGARGDMVQDPEADGGTVTAGSGYWEFFPSEFSKLVAGMERVSPEGQSAYTRIILQATFALGPHKPHPF